MTPPPNAAPAAPPARRRFPRWLWAILLLGGIFRFWALDWDQGTLSHPDERHVMMTAHRLAWPRSVGEYLDESRSPINPRNRETQYFAYGILPTTILTGLCEFAGVRRFEQQMLFARGLSATFDLGVVWLAFLIGRGLRRDDERAAERTGLLAALLYACAVSPIQHAHFFVTDPYGNFFIALALWLLTLAQQRGRLREYVLTGIALGLAVACKISLATFGLPAMLVALLPALAETPASAVAPRRLCAAPRRIIARWLVFGLATALTYRLAAPDAFSGWVTLAPRWLANMREIIGVTQGTVDVPFTRQWVSRTPLIFPWWNMVLWGMGLPLGLTAWAGACWAAWRLICRREWALFVPLAWIGTVFFHQGTQWSMTMRYFLPIYLPLIVLGAWALVRLAEAGWMKSARWRRWRWAPTALAALATLLWAIGFLHIYAGGHTRVRASRWIYEHVPRSAVLGVEHWDDSLPLTLPDTPGQEAYHLVELPWYDPDNDAKRDLILDRLNQADYLILASDKLYGSIPRMPHRYPMTIAYYRALFDGSLGFDLTAQFRGTMDILGWQFPTDAAEEAFSVYDHPRVMIFKKNAHYSADAVRAMLGAIDLTHVIDSRDLVPVHGANTTSADGKPLKTEQAILLDPHRWAAQQAGGTWSDIFNRHGFVNRHPTLCWVLLLLLLLAIGFPYAFIVCGTLPDRGVGLSRLAATSVPLWLLWLFASGEMVKFRASTWWLLLCLFALGGIGIAWRNRLAMRDFLHHEWRRLLAGELVFWLAFALCLTIRFLNPDLWHASWGGEKPMEMTYLYGVMKSEYFPPYNPWYAGGFINYYYFGFVLTGGLIKGIGVLPEVGFNLCLATWYGMTAAAAFSVTRALTARCASLWPAIAGSAFVALLGNLFQAKFIYLRLVELGKSDHELTIPLVSNVIRAAYGLRHVWHDHQSLFVYLSDPYWCAARAIPVTQPDSIPPITEFPFWSFLYADLHPHVIALPFTLALIGVLCAWCQTESRSIKIVLAAAMAFLLGLFWPTNTWDWPTYGALTGLTLFFSRWRRASETVSGFLKSAAQSVGAFLLILLAARLAFLPFYHHYVSGYGTFILWHGERTMLWDYFIIHGLFLFALATAYWAIWRDRHTEGLTRACQAWMLLLRQWLPGGRRNLRQELSARFERQPYAAVWAGTVFTLTVALVVWLITRSSLPALLCLGLLFSAVLAVNRRRDPLAAMPFVMASLGFALSLLVEFVVLDGDVGRMNTVFKFYYQVWTLFALAAAALLVEIWRALPNWRPKRRRVWLIAFGALLILAMLFPVTAVPAKIEDRFVRIPPTLDGLAYMDKARYQIQNREFALRGDLLAIRWLQDHIKGSPVVLEMNTGNILYSWGNRISIHTGLPSIAGWDWHQRQQQAGVMNNKVAERIADVQTLYSTTDPQQARFLLKKYNVGLVVVGDLERAFASEAGLQKFAPMGLEQIYDAEGVTIFRVKSGSTLIQAKQGRKIHLKIF